MIRNHIVFRDYETGSKNKFKTQPVQIAAVIIDLKRLEIVEDSLFESLIQPVFDEEECAKLGVDPIEAEALAKNNIKVEELQTAPSEKLVWEQYLKYLKDYNVKGNDGDKWDAPIVAGFNNRNFDDHICVRLCQKYGPKLDDYGGWSIYHPTHNFDLYNIVGTFFHPMDFGNRGSFSMDTCREYFGYKTDNAHKADVDVIQGADLLLRFLRLTKLLLTGEIDLPKGKRIKFKNCVGGKL